MKVCNTCYIEKPLSCFPENGLNKHGEVRYRADCTVCYNIKRKLNKKKHTKFVNNTKYRTGEENTYSLEDWRDALIYFADSCAYCGKKHSRRFKLTKDHIVPVDKGGVTVKCNIIPACAWCNSSKGNQDLETWYKKQKFYTVEKLNKIKKWGVANVF